MKSWRSLFAIVPACHAEVGHYSALWQRHFYEGLREAVPKLATPEVRYDWAYREGAPQERSATAEKLREQILRRHATHGLDAVFSYARSVEIDPSLVREIVAAGIPWINFFCDSIGDFDSVREIAAETSLNWFPESNAIPSYRMLGRPLACLPYAYNPQALLPLPSRAKRYAMGFVGMPTTNRVALLGALSLLGCPCEIRGHGWKESPPLQSFSPVKITRRIIRKLLLQRLSSRIGPALDDDSFLQFLAECHVVLGLNDARNANGRTESYLKFRDLEMPGYGCCYLTQDNADIRNCLEPGREVLVFSSLREARDKAWFHSRRPELAEKIAAAARRRVLAEHTWPRRLEEIQRALA